VLDQTFDYGAAVGGLVTALAAGGGLILTSWQIKLSRASDERANQWRRVEFVRTIVDQLDADEEVRFCQRALDWGVGPLPIPSRHRMLFEEQQTQIEQDTGKMERALRVKLEPDWRDPEMLLYRHCFDHFFSVIENIVRYGDRLGDEFIEDVGLGYHIELIKEPPYLGQLVGQSPLYDFISAYYSKLSEFIWAHGLRA